MPRVAKPKPKWNKDNIREMLVKSDKAVVRGLYRIHSFQTGEEQMSGQTVEDNGVGFNGVDADFLTRMVVWAKHHNDTLHPNQMVHVRKAMLKYSGQLARIANADELAKNG